MKTLVIINGVTGAIGTACLAQFSREPGTTIIGLSRKALPIDTFCRDGFLIDDTVVCSIGDIADADTCGSFARKIHKNLYEKIIYVHCVGIYPFELASDGSIQVTHDDDGDGIDDRVVKFSYTAFFAMTEALENAGVPLSAVIFGSVADKYEPAVHKSWWTVMQKTKKRMREISQENTKTSFLLLNISSVICPHEILTRPFVFQNTNADARFWLMPSEVAGKVAALVFSEKRSFVEDELFHKSNYYEDDYFADAKFTNRKRMELGLKPDSQ